MKIVFERKAKRKKSAKEFTKVMYKFNVAFVTIIVLLSFALMFISAFVSYIDLSPIGYIVPSAFGELALHTGFVIWKAKSENMRKYPDATAVALKTDDSIIYTERGNNRGDL